MLFSANVLESFLRGNDGRNVLRYVPASEMPTIQEAIEGYQLFMTLADYYAGEIIWLTRSQSEKKNSQGK